MRNFIYYQCIHSVYKENNKNLSLFKGGVMEKREMIGCIADDFTGASDVCSFLIDSGATCIIVNDIPEEKEILNVDVVVVALKIRSVPAEKALEKVKQTIKWFEEIGVTRVFDKYCSTFDSTNKGNIGPILDYLLEYYNQKYTIVSPALPKNKREVFNGYLFADGVLLSDGSMRNHPLTPMKDSYIPRLLEAQSKYLCHRLNHIDLLSGEDYINSFIEKFNDEKYFYICTDYFNEQHGEIIAKSFGNLKILSGSSSLINEWYKYLFKEKESIIEEQFENDNSKVLILSGSLSEQTTRQIENFINNGAVVINIENENLDNTKDLKDRILNESKDILVYSSRGEDFINGNVKNKAEKIEQFFGDLSKEAINYGIKKIIVAGGETSGAVIGALGYKSFNVGKNVAPGVPILRPIEKNEMQIVLKSGNFGQDDFFTRAIDMMR